MADPKDTLNDGEMLELSIEELDHVSGGLIPTRIGQAPPPPEGGP